MVCVLQILTSPDSTAHNPDTTFLMREFLQALVFLANYIYVERGLPTTHPVKDTSSGQLARHLSELISVHILPLAGSLEGPLYGHGKQNTRQALSYKDSTWKLFECIRNKVCIPLWVNLLLKLYTPCPPLYTIR